MWRTSPAMMSSAESCRRDRQRIRSRTLRRDTHLERVAWASLARVSAVALADPVLSLESYNVVDAANLASEPIRLNERLKRESCECTKSGVLRDDCKGGVRAPAARSEPPS